MGEISNTVNHYFSDNRRFADLFNGVYFQGEAVVKAEELTEVSEVYHEPVRKKGKRAERIRGVCKQLKSGKILRILALENQELIDYAMPFRCMQYDVMKYGKQLDILRKENQRKGKLKTLPELNCKLKRTDRIVPVYTLCLYHGTEEWDGPRTLRDMMDFGGEEDRFRGMFKDYPMQLYCLNEARDLQMFHTEVGTLFEALQHRKDREGLKRLIQSDPRYQQLDADTLEIMSVMLEWPSVWRQREKCIMNDTEDYDMCQAVREWAEEERSIGRLEGHKAGVNEKTYTIVKNMLNRGMADEDIMAIAECDRELLEDIRNK